MSINDFIIRFADMFDDVDAEALTPETNFRELDEWSSLTVLETIALADEEFNIVVSAMDIRKANTIGELFNLLNGK